MTWTAPRTWTTGELVTAALLNTHVRDNLTFLFEPVSDEDTGTAASFTNTVTADLDALTGTPMGSAVSVSVTTLTTALVFIAGQLVNSTDGSQTILQYRISGATTLAADDDRGIMNANVGRATCQTTIVQTGLTAGVNVFELQARVTGNTGGLERPRLTVIPLKT